MLKRVRRLRNQIAHDSSATDCDEEDAEWLEEFHGRLLAQEDPLALLEKAKQERLRAQAKRVNQPKIDPKRDENRGIQLAYLNEINPVELSAQAQRENKSNIYIEQNKERNTQLPKKVNTTTKTATIALIIILGLLVVLGAMAAFFIIRIIPNIYFSLLSDCVLHDNC